MPPNGSVKPNQRKPRGADTALPPPRQKPRPLLPGSPKARRDAHGNITNAADLSEATLALAQNGPRVLPAIPAPGHPSPTFRQQLAIHTRGEHVDQPHIVMNAQSGRRTAPKNGVRSQRYAPYARTPPHSFAARPGAAYAPPTVASPASRMGFVQLQQQYQHYPQQQYGNALPDADLMRFPSNSSQGTLGHGPSNAMGPRASVNGFREEALQAEDFQNAGLNLEAVRNESDGWYNLDQMASRPIFYQMEPSISAPPPAPVPGYQSHGHYGVPNPLPLPGPTFAGYNVAGAYQSPYAPTMYATQQAHFQPTFQPGPMYAPGSVNNNFVQ